MVYELVADAIPQPKGQCTAVVAPHTCVQHGHSAQPLTGLCWAAALQAPAGEALRLAEWRNSGR